MGSAGCGSSVALVTGATQGLGAGVAQELGRAGWTVYVTGRRIGLADEPGTVEQSADVVTAAGGHGVALRCDHADDAATEAAVARVVTETDRLDLLVNCAATVPGSAQEQARSFGNFWAADAGIWDTWFEVGVRSSYVATLHAARAMVARGRGLVVNPSSAAGEIYFGSVAYGTAKAALERFTADGAVQLRPHGIAMLAVRAGSLRTEKTARFEQAGLVSLADSETPGFTGRAVVALAADPDVLARTGGAYYTAALARDYGFTELDGSSPGLPTYGGLVQHGA